MRRQDKEIELAKKVWELVHKGMNNTNISKELDINRANVIAIKKYTNADMYLSYDEKNELIISYRTKLEKCQKNYKLILEEKTTNDEELFHCREAYFSIKPYQKYFYGALAAILMIGFFSGGYVERKIMESQGHFVTLEELFL